jgi:cation:H+ antiporter
MSPNFIKIQKDMFVSILALVLGFVGLIFAADKFSDSGAKLGKVFNVSPIVIGLLVFGFGTSAPEILVSGFAASSGNNGIGVGNALGSNIFNITLVLAISAIIASVPFEKSILKKEYLFLLILTLLLGFILYDNFLSYWDGVILLIIFALFLYVTFTTAKEELLEEAQTEQITEATSRIWITLIISLALLLGSSKLVVFGAVELATTFGVSQLIIGLTIVSLGTSLPELALAIASTIKKQHQMLIGNILGSNIFNSTAVLATVALINPSSIDTTIFNRDYFFVLVATLLIFALSYKSSGKHTLSRMGGITLLGVLCYYLYMLV